MAGSITLVKDGDVLLPEVLQAQVSAVLPHALQITPFCQVDTTLVGIPGNTIKYPVWNYIGMADDSAEAQDIDTRALSYETKEYTIRKIAVGVAFSDEALLSGYGNPQAEGERQVTLAMAHKIDHDAMEEIQANAPHITTLANPVGYEGVIDAIDDFEEEFETNKVLIIHPKQRTQLRKDPNFLSADKYPKEVILNGEIGQIAGCRVMVSKSVPLVAGKYHSVMIRLSTEQTEKDSNAFLINTPALTLFMKRNVNVEYERIVKNRTHEITADQIFNVVVTNPSSIRVCEFNA
ncbi:MAG: N4-gp56 family major capsid protein [Turicibacter sp.]|nr:N4-gp56 family major capsid protein [Turicibacter sp.]